MSDGKWMICTCCRRPVLINATGTCLACQHKYSTANQPDSWENIHNNDAIETSKSLGKETKNVVKATHKQHINAGKKDGKM